MKLLKKSVSLLLVLCMVLSFVPATVFAATGTDASFGDAEGFYKIVHLDAARKYWSKEVIYDLLEEMESAGYNQLQLYFLDNQGFRFALEESTITTSTGKTYDLSEAYGNGYLQDADANHPDWYRPSLEEENNYLTQTDMSDIIDYAASKGIDIVPCLNMPGHMGALLEDMAKAYPDVEWHYSAGTTTSKSSINLKDAEAKAFALALLKAYVEYFASEGCKYFSIGGDEYAYDVYGNDLGVICSDPVYTQYVIPFMNDAAGIIKGKGMIPRAFNDFFYYNNQTDTAYQLDEDFQVCFWGWRTGSNNTEYASVQTIVDQGHDVINTSDNCYYALSSEWYDLANLKSRIDAFDVNTITIKNDTPWEFPIENPAGAMFCIWCDRGYLDAEKALGGDGGALVLEQVLPHMQNFASKMPESQIIELKIDQTYSETFTVNGEYTADQIAEKYGFGEVITAANVTVEKGESGTDATDPQPVTSIVSGGTYIFSDGNRNYLMESPYLNSPPTNTTNHLDASRLIITATDTPNQYTIQSASNDKYMYYSSWGYGEIKFGDAEALWTYDSTTMSFSMIESGDKQTYVLCCSAEGAWKGVVGGTSPAKLYTPGSAGEEGTLGSTTFTFQGAKVGTVTFTGPDGVMYTVKVSAEGHVHDYSIPATCKSAATCSCGEADPNGSTDESNHIGTLSTATCAAPATYSECKHTVGNRDLSNHVGDTEYRNSTDDYQGDLYCKSCNTQIGSGERKNTKTDSDTNVSVTHWGDFVVTVSEAMGNHVEVDGADMTVSYDITVTVNGVNYTGSAKVSLPIPSGWDEDKTFPAIVNDVDKSVEKITTYTNANGYCTFTAPHFSEIVLYYDGEGGVTYITMDADSVYTVTENGELGEKGSFTDDSGLFSYTVDHVAASGGIDSLGVGSSMTCKITDGNGNYLMADGSNGTSDTASEWTITRVSNTEYTIKSGANYVQHSSGAVAVGSSEEKWLVDENGFYYLFNSIKYHIYWNGAWKWYVYNGVTSDFAVPEGGSSTPTTKITFNAGKSNGTDTVEIGGKTFSITVINGEDIIPGDSPCANHVWDPANYGHDDNNHWLKCNNEGCTATKSVAAHSGGTATCAEQATCSVCQQKYGSTDDENHVFDTAWISGEDGHYHVCVNHPEVKSEAVPHTGGNPTCAEDSATCTECGGKYSDPSVHTWLDADNKYKYGSDNTDHWHICQNCDAEGTHEAHTAESEATCVAKARCSVCGSEYGSLNKNNHVGTQTKIADEIPATDEQDGTTAKYRCESCEKEYGGTVIPSLNSQIVEITIASGSTKEIIVKNTDVSNSIEVVDTNKATVTGVYDPGKKDKDEVKPSEITSLEVGKSYILSDGNNTNFMHWSGDVANSTEHLSAAKWIIEYNEDTNLYYIRQEGTSKYAHIPQYELTAIRLDSAQTAITGWNYDDITHTLSAVRDGKTYVLSIEGTTWRGRENPETPAIICTPGSPFEKGYDPYTTITIEGVTPGTTIATVGDTRYRINVVDSALLDTKLALDCWITNNLVEFTTGTVTYITAADHINITTESGAPLAGLVPVKGSRRQGNTESFVNLWKGMLHTEKQINVADVSTGTAPDLSDKGTQFHYVRYYDGKWEVSEDQVNWLPTEGKYLNIYYLQETGVTQEVKTEVVDWGEDYVNECWANDTFVLLDFAVAEDGVGRTPTLDAYPNSGVAAEGIPNQMTTKFHCFHESGKSDEKVQQLGDDIYTQLGLTKDRRRVDTIYGRDSDTHEIYMITLTPSRSVTQSLTDGVYNYTYDYLGGDNPNENAPEMIVWTKTEAIYESKVGQPTFNGKTLVGCELRPSNDTSKNFIYRTVGGDPNVPYVWINENEAMLVTYYIRAKATDDSLKVHYRLEGSETEFHNYNIAVESGTYFGYNFRSVNNVLHDNTLTNLYGHPETVYSDLSKMYDIDAVYRTGVYKFNGHLKRVYVNAEGEEVIIDMNDDNWQDQVSELDGDYNFKEIILYYSVDNVHFVPIDFDRDLLIGPEFFEHHVAEGSTVQSIKLQGVAENADRVSGKHGYFEATPNADGKYRYVLTSILEGQERMFDFELSVQVPKADSETEIVPETHHIIILPATTVYYDQLRFFGFSQNSSWKPSSKTTSNEVQEALCAKDTETNVYGHNSVDANILGASAGMYIQSNPDATKEEKPTGSISFTFVGTGADIYANCSTSSGMVMVVVRKNGVDGQLVRLLNVDTKIASGTTQGATEYDFGESYNVPIVALRDLPHGRYYVEIRHVALKNQSALPVQIDGFRIYNTLRSTDSVYGAFKAGEDVYKYDSENNPVFVEVRDIALANLYVEESYKGNLYADDIAEYVMSQVHATGENNKISGLVIDSYNDRVATSTNDVKVDIITNGPKNEIYLWPGQTLAISTSSTMGAQIGLKALNGVSVQYELDGKEATLNSSTDMFYWADGQDGSIIIKNVSGGVLAVTKLKCFENFYGTDNDPGLDPLIQVYDENSLLNTLIKAGFPYIKNGLIYDEDDELRYYVDDEAIYAGVVQDEEGNFYYINSSKKAVKNCTYSIGEGMTNGLIEPGTYQFDENGKMIIPGADNGSETKSGLSVDPDGEIRFYINGVATYAGVVQDDAGNFYYINSSKTAVKDCTYRIASGKTNGLIEAGTYRIDENGKLVVSSDDVTSTAKNGLTIDPDGEIRFYKDGVAVFAGLVQDDEGNYYYINSTLKAAKSCTYAIGEAKTNGLLPGGIYRFGADGKMEIPTE